MRHPHPPLFLPSRPLSIETVGCILLGIALLVAGSHVSLPMYPVPMTMQTFAVTIIGALYGWRLGSFTVTAWLALAVAGAPVLAGGAGGAAHFIGPTGGYLVAFPITAALVGWLVERGWNGASPVLSLLAMLLGTAFCLSLGALWLATLIGLEAAFTHGVSPFLLGSVVKSALGAVTMTGLSRLRGKV